MPRPPRIIQTQEIPPAVKQPCNDCPWRRSSAAGWLGPYDALTWVLLAGSEEPIACHQTIRESGSWDGAFQCAGAATYRANSCKSPRDPAVAVGPTDHENVFSNSMEFINHHERKDQP